MNLKKSFKKGFTLIELVVTIAIALILFSLLGNLVSSILKSTQKISLEEETLSELYFFENFVRDEITSAEKIIKDNENTFKLVLKNEDNKDKYQEVYYYLNRGQILRSGGSNVLLSWVKNYNANYNDGIIKMNIELKTGKKRDIIVEVRAEEVSK